MSRYQQFVLACAGCLHEGCAHIIRGWNLNTVSAWGTDHVQDPDFDVTAGLSVRVRALASLPCTVLLQSAASQGVPHLLPLSPLEAPNAGEMELDSRAMSSAGTSASESMSESGPAASECALSRPLPGTQGPGMLGACMC